MGFKNIVSKHEQDYRHALIAHEMLHESTMRNFDGAREQIGDIVNLSVDIRQKSFLWKIQKYLYKQLENITPKPWANDLSDLVDERVQQRIAGVGNIKIDIIKTATKNSDTSTTLLNEPKIMTCLDLIQFDKFDNKVVSIQQKELRIFVRSLINEFAKNALISAIKITVQFGIEVSPPVATKIKEAVLNAAIMLPSFELIIDSNGYEVTFNTYSSRHNKQRFNQPLPAFEYIEQVLVDFYKNY